MTSYNPLTTHMDTVVAEAGVQTYVSGDNLTLTNGDSIIGNGSLTQVNLTLDNPFSLATNQQPGLATIQNAEIVYINLNDIGLFPEPVILNAADWSDITKIKVGPASLGGELDIAHAGVGTTYILANGYTGYETYLDIDFRKAGVENISLRGSYGEVSLDSVLQGTVALTTKYSNDVELDVHGANLITESSINPGGKNTLDIYGLSDGFTLNMAASSAVNYVYVETIDNTDFVTGGSTGKDTLSVGSIDTADAQLHLTNVQNFIAYGGQTSGGAATFDGTNTSGLQTITYNDVYDYTDLNFVNLTTSVTTVTVNDAPGSVDVAYAAVAPTLTVNYGTYGDSSTDLFFMYDLKVSNVASLTVNISKEIVNSAELTIDPVNTTSVAISVNHAGSYSPFEYIYSADALTSLSLTAAGKDSDNGLYGLEFANASPTSPLAHLSLTASGASSDVWFEPGGSSTDHAYSLQSLSITASGANSTAEIKSEDLYSQGNMSTLAITASGTGSYATADADVYINADSNGDGNLGLLSVTASGVSSSAETYAIYVNAGNVSTVDVAATAKKAYASLDTLSVDGNIGHINVTAMGASADSYVDIYALGVISNVSLTASGGTATAYSLITADIAGANIQSVSISSAVYSSVDAYLTNVDSQGGKVTATGAGTIDISLDTGYMFHTIDASGTSGKLDIYTENLTSAGTEKIYAGTGTGQLYSLDSSAGAVNILDFTKAFPITSTAVASAAAPTVTVNETAMTTDSHSGFNLGYGAGVAGTNLLADVTATSFTAFLADAKAAISGAVHYYEEQATTFGPGPGTYLAVGSAGVVHETVAIIGATVLTSAEVAGLIHA